MTPTLYRGLTALAGPFARLYLARRQAVGKEDGARIEERLGRPSRPRPEGALIWVHGASVGEAVSALPLIGRLLEERLDAHVLVTTGTVTSAKIMAERLPARALHQYVPLDGPKAARRFLDHWRPDLVLWLESDLWPNLLFATGERDVPRVLVNARMSSRSFARWRRFPRLIRPLIEGFALVLAQSATEAARFEALGAGSVKAPGNLKYDAPPLSTDEGALARAREMLEGRRVWLAASTHPGEESIAGRVHMRLKRETPSLITLLVPRHPERGASIKAELEQAGLSVALRSREERVSERTDVYLADTLGELGLFYRLSPVVFVGGSLVPHGGQNPLEPARLESALIFGPHTFNFTSIVAAMREANAALEVADERELAEALGALLRDEVARTRLAAGAAALARNLSGVLERVLAELRPYLPARSRFGEGRSAGRRPLAD